MYKIVFALTFIYGFIIFTTDGNNYLHLDPIHLCTNLSVHGNDIDLIERAIVAAQNQPSMRIAVIRCAYKNVKLREVFFLKIKSSIYYRSAVMPDLRKNVKVYELYLTWEKNNEPS